MFIFHVVEQYFSVIKENLLLNNRFSRFLYNIMLSKHMSFKKAETLKTIQKSPEFFSESTPSDGRWFI